MMSEECYSGTAFRVPRELGLAVVREVQHEALACAGGRPIVLDASGVEVVDLAGLQLLIASQRQNGAPGKSPPQPCSAVVIAAMARAGILFPGTN